MCRGSFPCCLEWSVTTYAVAAPCSNLLGDGTESKRSTAGPHQPELPREAVLIDEGLPAHGRHHVLAHKRERCLRDALVHRLQPIPLAPCAAPAHMRATRAGPTSPCSRRIASSASLSSATSDGRRQAAFAQRSAAAIARPKAELTQRSLVTMKGGCGRGASVRRPCSGVSSASEGHGPRSVRAASPAAVLVAAPSGRTALHRQRREI